MYNTGYTLASCKEYIYPSQFIGDSVTTLSKTPVGWEGMTFGQLILRKIIQNVATRCQI